MNLTESLEERRLAAHTASGDGCGAQADSRERISRRVRRTAVLALEKDLFSPSVI